MENGQIFKVILYGELASIKRTIGCPQLCCTEICKHNMGALSIDHRQWKGITADGGQWRWILWHQLRKGEERIFGKAGERWMWKHRGEQRSTRQSETLQNGNYNRTVNPALASSAAPDVAPVAGLISTRVHYSWSTLTNGGLVNVYQNVKWMFKGIPNFINILPLRS